jgi:predicted 3-demethylubiquinone-9 3-methyltransferase (glyoxalase superfamily)
LQRRDGVTTGNLPTPRRHLRRLRFRKPQACGWLNDRFGVRWQIVPTVLETLMRDPDPARAKKVADAMMKMVKLDIAALQKAARS